MWYSDNQLRKKLDLCMLLQANKNIRVLLFLGPQPPAPFTFLRPPAQLLFRGPHVSKLLFDLLHQNYYLKALLVESISCISVLSKFQTFQLKEHKICNQSRGVATNRGLGARFKSGLFLYRKYEGGIKECNIVILC